MISEVSFSQNNSSSWKILTPTMDSYVRRINTELYEREEAPMDTATDPTRRALINEIAFQLFSLSLKVDPTTDDAIEDAVRTASKKIALLEGLDAQNISKPTDFELSDSQEQMRRLQRFFERVTEKKSIQIGPHFPGCGIIDSCSGDVYFRGRLFEIKAGSRKFRSMDIRQLLVYCALNQVRADRPIDTVGIYNPRLGISFCEHINLVAYEISGTTPLELLNQIIEMISSGGVSR